MCVHTLQHIYISQLGRFHDSSDWLWLPKLNHASPLYYPRGIRVQVPKQNGIKALDGLMVTTMLVPGIARISGIPSPSLLEIRFPSNYANKWSRTGKNAAPLLAGRKRNREWTKELDFFASFSTKEETMEETVGRLRSDYSRILQFWIIGNCIYLVIDELGEYNFVLFVCASRWIKVSCYRLASTFFKDLDLENCIFFFFFIWKIKVFNLSWKYSNTNVEKLF